MNINVKDFMKEDARKRNYEVGDTIYVPYRITEINQKQTGETVLKQFHLEGPALNPFRETYTEYRLREIFEAI